VGSWGSGNEIGEVIPEQRAMLVFGFAPGRGDRGLEVDFILETDNELKLIEVKHQGKFRADFETNLLELEGLLKKKEGSKKSSSTPARARSRPKMACA